MTSVSLFEQIAGFMDVAERRYQSVDVEDSQLIVAEIGGDDGTWSAYIQITDDQERRLIVVHAHLPARIPENNRLKVAQLLTRINYDLIVGNFEMNFDDGGVLLKTTLDLADGQLTQAMFEQMYETNCHMMNEYYAKILSVGFGEPGGQSVTDNAKPEGVMLQ